MARRKSKAKQREELIQSTFLFVLLVTGFGTLALTKSVNLSIMVCLISVGVVIAVLISNKNQRTKRLKHSGIEDIDQLDGIQFEKYLSHLFTAHGYKTQVTKAAGDYGADLILEKAGSKIVVQAKRYSNIKAVQEAQAAIAHYGATEAWVVTSSDYTEAARNLASSNRVKFINRDTLIEMILVMKNKGKPIPEPSEVIIDAQTKQFTCPKCGNLLVLRSSSRGPFYGCSSFPKCRYIKKNEAV
ncbi:restriction endonuclease [Paenibacillus sp. Marseille-Q7038]